MKKLFLAFILILSAVLAFSSCETSEKACEHSFSEWSVITEASCEKDGEKEAVCELCGEKKTEKTDKLGHVTAIDSAVEATCTETGLSEGAHCSVCEKILTEQETTLALGHDYKDTVVEPTKTEEGYTEHTCSRCGDTYKDTPVPATGSVGLTYEVTADNTCVITGMGTCSDTEIIIPKTIDGYTVVGIKSKAFMNSAAITSIAIPETVATVEASAFSGCTALRDVSVEKEDAFIAEDAFIGCKELQNIEVGEKEVTVKTEEEKLAYQVTSDTTCTVTGIGTWKGTELIIPATIDGYAVTAIGASAFQKNTALTKIVVPSGVLYIGDDAFADCTALLSLSIPESVNHIGNRVCWGDRKLRTITLPKTLDYLGFSAFIDCNSLESIEVPLVKSGKLLAFTFSTCKKVKKIVIPHGTVSLGADIFIGCSSLEEVVIPDTVTSIGGLAFTDCTSLKEITIPDSVTEYADGRVTSDVFRGCTSLTKVKLSANATLTSFMFEGCTALKEIYIPVNARDSSGGWTFKGCTALERVVFADNVTYCSRNMFEGCTALKEVILPDSLLVIDNYMFSGCTALTNVKWPSALERIADNAFENCTSLTSVDLMPNTYLINENAFKGCTSLTNINFPTSVGGKYRGITIRPYVFDGCTALTGLDVPNLGETVYISKNAFNNCSSLTKISSKNKDKKGNNLTSVFLSSFSGCPLSGIPEDEFIIYSE